MGYIDKDKALNLDFKINVSLFESRRKTAERAVQAYADAISAIPAADVRPVRRGKWSIVYDDFMKSHYDTCSCCGKEYFGANGFNFCPNCGAMMEES